ncbi:MAG: acyltransferase family protein [Candidatus Limnocylindrales bacterium]
MRATASGWRLGHRPSLDALRGIAILLVLLSHAGVPYLGAAGFVGVSLFFALSGYLITALLLCELADHRAVDLRAFYLRRARRLLPGLAVLLAATGGWAIASGSVASWLPAGLAAAFYVGNWAFIAGLPMAGLGHTWSLAVEEQFYFTWPLVLLLLMRMGPRAAIAGALVIVALSFAAEWAALPSYGHAYYGSDTRAKDLLLGCVVAMISMHRGVDFRIPTAAAIGAAAVLVFLCTAPDLPGAPLVVSPAVVMVVAWCAARPQFAAWRWLTATGRISYGLYLYHVPILVGPLAGLSLWPRVVALLASSYAAAASSWVVLESRVLRRGVSPSARPAWAKQVPEPKSAELADPHGAVA